MKLRGMMRQNIKAGINFLNFSNMASHKKESILRKWWNLKVVPGAEDDELVREARVRRLACVK